MDHAAEDFQFEEQEPMKIRDLVHSHRRLKVEMTGKQLNFDQWIGNERNLVEHDSKNTFAGTKNITEEMCLDFLELIENVHFLERVINGRSIFGIKYAIM